MSDLPDWVKPGATYRLFDRKFHVRGIVDGYVVLREWWPGKRRWNYTVEHPVHFEVVGDRIKVLEKGGAKSTLKLLTAGRLSPGDAVRLDESGCLAKAEVGSPHLGTLPAGTVFHNGYAEVPGSWVRDQDNVTRQNLKPKVF